VPVCYIDLDGKEAGFGLDIELAGIAGPVENVAHTDKLGLFDHVLQVDIIDNGKFSSGG
jgi:hypothetical protein